MQKIQKSTVKYDTTDLFHNSSHDPSHPSIRVSFWGYERDIINDISPSEWIEDSDQLFGAIKGNNWGVLLFNSDFLALIERFATIQSDFMLDWFEETFELAKQLKEYRALIEKVLISQVWTEEDNVKVDKMIIDIKQLVANEPCETTKEGFRYACELLYGECNDIMCPSKHSQLVEAAASKELSCSIVLKENPCVQDDRLDGVVLVEPKPKNQRTVPALLSRWEFSLNESRQSALVSGFSISSASTDSASLSERQDSPSQNSFNESSEEVESLSEELDDDTGCQADCSDTMSCCSDECYASDAHLDSGCYSAASSSTRPVQRKRGF